MSVTTTAVSQAFSGNGVTVTFTVPFPFLATADLVVTQKIGAGTATTLTLGSQYTASVSNNTITMSAAPATGTTITVTRVTPVTQATSLSGQGTFYPSVHEAAWDKLTLIEQESLSRTVALETETAALDVRATALEVRATDLEERATVLEERADELDERTEETQEQLDALEAVAITGGASLGASGVEVYASTASPTMYFKKLVAGTNLTLTAATNTVTIDVVAATLAGDVTGPVSATVLANIPATVTSTSTSGMKITSSAANSGSNTAFTLDTANTLNGGTSFLKLKSQGTDKWVFDVGKVTFPDGTVQSTADLGGTISAMTGDVTAAGVGSVTSVLANIPASVTANGTSGTTVTSSVANSGTNAAFVLDTANTMSGSTAYLKLKNHGTDKWVFDTTKLTFPDGTMQSTAATGGGGGGGFTALTGDVTASGTGTVAATLVNIPAAVTATSTTGTAITSSVANSSTNTAFALNTVNAMSGSTNLLKVKSNSVDKVTLAASGTVFTVGDNTRRSALETLTQTGSTYPWLKVTSSTDAKMALGAGGANVPIGSLVKTSTTNLILNSQRFGGGGWSGVSGNGPAVPTATDSTTDVWAPDGTHTAIKVVLPAVSGVNAFSVFGQSVTTAAGPFIFSVYLRTLTGTATTYIARGDDSSEPATPCSVTSTWQRFTVTMTNTAASHSFQFGTNLINTEESSTSAATIYAWGFQLETGSSATPYVATTGASATGVAVTGTTDTNHKFRAGSTVTLSPGETGFPAGTYTVFLTPSATTFTYNTTGLATTSTVAQLFSTDVDVEYSRELSADGTELAATIATQGTPRLRCYSTRIEAGGNLIVGGGADNVTDILQVTGSSTFSSTCKNTVASGSQAFQVTEGALVSLNGLAATSYLKGGATNHEVLLSSNVTNSSTNTAYVFDTANALTASTKLLAAKTAGTEKVAFDHAGKPIYPTGTADAVVGTATLSGGTVTISTTSVTASSKIYVSHAGTTITNAGHLYPNTISAGTSFKITSTNASDTDTVNWWIVN
jgi:hypothetical protein